MYAVQIIRFHSCFLWYNRKNKTKPIKCRYDKISFLKLRHATFPPLPSPRHHLPPSMRNRRRTEAWRTWNPDRRPWWTPSSSGWWLFLRARCSLEGCSSSSTWSSTRTANNWPMESQTCDSACVQRPSSCYGKSRWIGRKDLQPIILLAFGAVRLRYRGALMIIVTRYPDPRERPV